MSDISQAEEPREPDNLPEQHLDVLGVRVRLDLTMNRIIELIGERARRKSATHVAFINADCLNIACNDSTYKQLLERQTFVLPDGIGVKIAARFHGMSPIENLNGTDMLPRLCQLAVDKNLGLYFLGAKPGVVEQMRDNLIDKFPGLKVAGVQNGFFDHAASDTVIADINNSGADILLVAFGAPRQEKWLDEHRDALTVPVRMGVGGLFDFFSGNVPRAPEVLRNNGLEWCWRLAQEPKRLFRRYVLGNPLFLWRVGLERWGLKKF